jgi:hypothetical protein
VKDEPDPSAIVPLIKRVDTGGLGDAVTLPDSYIPVVERLTPYLWTAYVFDLPGRFDYVTPLDCAHLGLGPANLRSLAVRNLTERRDKPKIRWHGGALTLTLDGNLEASLLLVDHVWPQVSPGVAGDLVAAVPSRDTLVVTGTDNPVGMKFLELCVDEVWRTAETRILLTKKLLIRRYGAWDQLDGPYPRRR